MGPGGQDKVVAPCPKGAKAYIALAPSGQRDPRVDVVPVGTSSTQRGSLYIAPEGGPFAPSGERDDPLQSVTLRLAKRDAGPEGGHILSKR